MEYSGAMSTAPLPLDLGLIGVDAADMARLAAMADEGGFARLWSAELYRSATVPLALAATVTRRIELATGIALAFTRSPMVLALEALDLDEISGGRTIIGLGAGVRRLNERWHAAAYDPPVARMRETIAALRELVAALAERRDARSAGKLVDIEVVGYRRPVHAARTRIPIWLAAVMPGMAGLAGEVADGFLDHPVTSLDWLDERLRPAIARGAERAGREPPPICGGLIVAVDDADPERARRAAALSVGFYATVRTYEELFSNHGFAGRLGAIRRAFLRGDDVALADAVGRDMVDAFAAAGSAAEVATAVERYRGRVARLWLSAPHHAQTPREASAWQEAIIGAFATR